jgi:hypothetical protein
LTRKKHRRESQGVYQKLHYSTSEANKAEIDRVLAMACFKYC